MADQLSDIINKKRELQDAENIKNKILGIGANLLAGGSAVAADTAGGISPTVNIPRNEGLLAESKREANPDYATSSPAKGTVGGIGGQNPKMLSLIPGALPGEGMGDEYQGIYGVGKTPAKVAAGETVKEAAKPHPMAQYKDVYDFAEKSKPEELKAFIERNKDNPDLKGLGYIETIDPTTKKLRIEKVISRPEAQGIGPMTIEQATAAAHLKAANRGDAVAESMAEDRRERLDLLRLNAEENRGIKRETNFDKTLAGVGSVYDAESGKTVLHPALGLFSLYQQGYDERNVPEHYKPVMSKVKTEFERFVNDWAASPKSKKGGAPVTAAERMSLAKIFEGRLKGTNAPK